MRSSCSFGEGSKPAGVTSMLQLSVHVARRAHHTLPVGAIQKPFFVTTGGLLEVGEKVSGVQISFSMSPLYERLSAEPKFTHRPSYWSR